MNAAVAEMCHFVDRRRSQSQHNVRIAQSGHAIAIRDAIPRPVIGITILMLRGAAPITQATSSHSEGIAIPSLGILSLF